MSSSDRNKPKNSASSDSTYTVMEFQREFPNDAACLEYLWKQNYSPDGRKAHCPICDRERSFHKVASRPSWSCDSCGKHIHPTANTIFHKSSTSLQLWFYAIYLMSTTRCGISAKELERQLGVTYKTAWRMANLIRNELMSQDDEPLSGDVEVDETFIGGKPRVWEKKTAWQHRERKAIVMGAVERKGKIKASVIPHTGGVVVQGKVHEYVLQGSNLYTDEYPGYSMMSKRGYNHRTVLHKSKIYVQGDVHTQTIEGFWSHLKNGLRGTHHSVSKKWLQSYVDEFVFRYNNRETNMFRTLLLRACEA